MRRTLVFIVLVLAAAGAVAYGSRGTSGPKPAAALYRTAAIERGDIVAAVSATGTVAPTTTVIVGSQLSGQVVEVLADYNSQVKAGQVLARLNRQQIEAKRDAARADLAQARAARLMQDAQAEKVVAEMARAEAAARDMEAQSERIATLLDDAERVFQRQEELKSRGIASEAAFLTARTQRDAQRSQLESSHAQIESTRAQMASLKAEAAVVEAQKATSEALIAQKEAVVRQIEVDLANTEIRSPVDGVVVQRNIELGATVAASLTAPTLFLVAQDLTRIEVQANVDEADVGRVRPGQVVRFQVNAYPGRTFEGRVRQVRLGSQTVQNVVIYTTVIDVPNPDLDLMPGMTATLRIMTEERRGVLRIANAALRWRPPVESGDPADSSPAGPFVHERADARPDRPRRGDLLTRLSAELKLDEQQMAAVREILARHRPPERSAPATQDSEALFAEPGPGRGGRGGGRGGLQRLMAEVEAVLTPEQRTAFEAFRQQGRQGRGRGMGRESEGAPGRLYLLGADEQPVRVTVRLGATDGSFTEILSGAVEAGQRAITGGGSATRAPGERPFRLGF